MATFGIQKLVLIYSTQKERYTLAHLHNVEILTDYVQLVNVPERFLIVLYLRVYFLAVMGFRWAPNLKRVVVVVVLLRGRSMHA